MTVDTPSLTVDSPPDTRTPVSRPRRRRGTADYGSWWWAFPALAAIFCVHYLATAMGGVYAFTDWTGIGSFNWIGIDNFVEIFQTPTLLAALRNTLVMAAIFVVATNVIGLLFALALNRTLKLRYVLRVVLFAPVVLSSLAVSYIFKFIFDFNGPLNGVLEAVGLSSWQRTWLGDPFWAFVAIMAVLIWQSFGLTMVIYLAGLATVPRELEEAAAIDGATMWQRMRYVVFPSLQPAIAIATTLTLINGLRVFDQVMAMTAGGPFGATDTLATVVYSQTFAFGKFGFGSALALTLSVLVVLAAVLQLRLTRNRNAEG